MWVVGYPVDTPVEFVAGVGVELQLRRPLQQSQAREEIGAFFGGDGIALALDAFIDLAFEMGPVPGMTAKEIKRYIRYIADWRLGQLGLPAIYMVEDHPLPWLAPLLNGVEHANFFETRATEYSKGATTGDWNSVWSSFDKRQKAKAVNEDTVEVPEVGLFGVEAAE